MNKCYKSVVMFRHQMHAMKRILQPCCFHSVETALFEKKLALQNQRLSTKSCDSHVLNGIPKLRKNELRNTSSKEWVDRANVLKSYAFEKSECFKILYKHPGILKIPLTDFENTVRQWSYSNLAMSECRTVLSFNPVLLEIEHNIIRKRLPHLFAFCGSSSLLTELLVKSPCVMFDDWNVLLEKVNYLLNVRGFKIKCVVDSFGLSRSLDFIKFRFDLLEKCGIYKQMPLHAHKINKYDQSQHRNPTLKDILHLDVEYFTQAIAKISPEEYEVSYELFMMEENEANMDSDADDDDEQQC